MSRRIIEGFRKSGSGLCKSNLNRDIIDKPYEIHKINFEENFRNAPKCRHKSAIIFEVK